MTDKHGDEIEEGQILTREHHKWLYKTMLTEDGKLIVRGINCKHSTHISELNSHTFEIIGELTERMRDED